MCVAVLMMDITAAKPKNKIQKMNFAGWQREFHRKNTGNNLAFACF